MSDHGRDKLVTLLMDCPYLKLIGNVVYLRTALLDAGNNLVMTLPSVPSVSSPPPALQASASAPEESKEICDVCDVCVIVCG